MPLPRPGIKTHRDFKGAARCGDRARQLLGMLQPRHRWWLDPDIDAACQGRTGFHEYLVDNGGAEMKRKGYCVDITAVAIQAGDGNIVRRQRPSRPRPGLVVAMMLKKANMGTAGEMI